MFNVGWAKATIENLLLGYVMHGYGMLHQRAEGHETPLYARAIVIEDAQGNEVIYVLLDLGYITWAMREHVLKGLTQIDPHYDQKNLVLTATHTHSGPGGCAYEAMYNLVTPSYLPQHVESITKATLAAITTARAQKQLLDLTLGQYEIPAEVEVAWNRSIRAYNQNPDIPVKRTIQESHLAINRQMTVLSFRKGNQPLALMSWFGVHATAVSNRLKKYCCDNKGYAAMQAEEQLPEGAVALFSQGTAGDVSPLWQGRGAYKKRLARVGDEEYAYAKQNGLHQTVAAMEALKRPQLTIEGTVESILTYVDFTDIQVDPEFAGGRTDAETVDPCHGVDFAKGTVVDGPAMAAPLVPIMKALAKRTRYKDLHPTTEQGKALLAYYQKLYKAQDPKSIMMEFGGKHKRAVGIPFSQLKYVAFIDPSIHEIVRQVEAGGIGDDPLLPTVLPLQIIRIGQLGLICCPGEWTTIAGQRLARILEPILLQKGITQTVVTSYCNEFMGYVTTNEEYQVQCYEGGHTVYGQWTHAGFMTKFQELAKEFLKPVDKRKVNIVNPSKVHADQLDKRTNFDPYTHQAKKPDTASTKRNKN